MPTAKRVPKLVKYEDSKLYMRKDSKEVCLGELNTHKGGLTRAQKLQAVSAKGDWISV